MAIENLISLQFTDAELQIIDEAITKLEDVIKPKAVQMTPEERQQYGRLGNETEGWSLTVREDCTVNSVCIPAFVDVAEWDRDIVARKLLMPRLARMAALNQMVEDTGRLLGYDIFLTTQAVYRNARFLAGQNVPGSSSYYEKWRVQFPGTTRLKTPPATPPPAANSGGTGTGG